LRNLHVLLVLARIRSPLRRQPTLEESVCIAAERPQLDALLFLEISVVLICIISLYFHRAVEWVVDVDVSSRAWLFISNVLVAGTSVAAAECHMDCLFLNYFIFDVFFFLQVLVLPRAWVLVEGLLSVWRFAFVTPEVASLCLR